MPQQPDQKAAEYRRAMREKKAEAARQAGLDGKVASVGWSNMTAAECGKIGGLMGGRIGGQMVKRMLEAARFAAEPQDLGEK